MREENITDVDMERKRNDSLLLLRGGNDLYINRRHEGKRTLV